MGALGWLMAGASVVLAALLSSWVARRPALPLGRLLLGLTAVYLLAGLAVVLLWTLGSGRQDKSSEVPISSLLIGAMALVPHLAEVSAVRALRLPARWGVVGLGLVLPVLGLVFGAALVQPHMLGILTGLLLWTVGLAAALALLAALWQVLERVWVLPAKEEKEGAGGPAKGG
ncbi:hypothetical protein [Deinococcus budaensis]|uniref:Uncharacterized protein n=1 Tax=Deinococcus budaensis TaxID=1665626 RepID=A0A7W8LRD8_9DEIO|nr:hypothetical protein [Deinococcus budaensis]MBB5235714.1 hypothetical protein [Deinococcus budaensis]